MTTMPPATLPSTPTGALELGPAPALLRALANVGEVDLAVGLGHRRLAEVIRRTGPLEPPAGARRRLLALRLLAGAACLLLLALG